MSENNIHTTNGTVSEAQAAQIVAKNEKIWDEFWAIPAKERTAADWQKLLEVQFMVKNDPKT